MNPLARTSIRFDSVVPQFTVPDVVHTAQYYRDVLGFEIAGYWDGQQVHLDVGRPAVLELCSATRPACISIARISPIYGPGGPRVRMTSTST